MNKKRAKGEGTLRKRKDGRWEGRVVIGYDGKNLPITKNVTAKTKTECAEKLEKLKEQYIKPTEKIAVDMTFGEWIDFWYRTYCKNTIRKATQEERENCIYNHIIPAVGKIPLKALKTADLQQFYNLEKQSGRKIRTDIYGEGLSDRTVHLIHSSCRSALERAVDDGLMNINPADGTKLPRDIPKEIKILKSDEIARFLYQAKEEGYYELFLLELMTGMRRGEILALRWSDLDFRTGELKIERQVRGGVISVPKTKSSVRTIILPTALLEILSEYKKSVNSEWIFPSPKDSSKTRDPSAARKRLQIILDRAGCKRMRFHDLRHTFATMALEHGMDVKTLSATIGHMSAKTTLNVYSHITDTMREQAAVKIDRSIGGTNAQIPRTESKSEVAEKTPFEPYKPKIRKAGTGCISKLNEHLYEGRYSPRIGGKRISRNVYAKTREECEERLAELIKEMKTELKI